MDDTQKKPRRKKQWWICAGGLFESGKAQKYSGPYSTREDAFVARSTIEKLRGVYDLFVDSRYSA